MHSHHAKVPAALAGGAATPGGWNAPPREALAPPPAAGYPGAMLPPTVHLRPGADRRARAGHPWIYSNELAPTPAWRDHPPGAPALVNDARGRPLGVYALHPHTLLAGRLLSPDPAVPIDTAFFAARLRAAAALRARLYPSGHHRLIHAEADGLPGLVIDRYGDTFAVQPNSAFADRHLPALLDALDAVFAPARILLRADSGARAAEGLPQHAEVLRGSPTDPIHIHENGATFLAHPTESQKTGWFFDQRENRAFIAALTPGARVLDVYSYAGGFGVLCAVRGAAHVTCVDRSAEAVERIAQAAHHNAVADRVLPLRAEAFAHLAADDAPPYDVVIADPPAFAKARKDLDPALRGYRKLARLAAARVAPGGLLLLGSCSHHVDPPAFFDTCAAGLHDAGRPARLLRSAGAGPDHPVHPALPESAYLKALVFQLD